MARKNEIVDSIVERLRASGMTPQDVVSISGGRIPITQAYDWFRDWKLSVIAALLLECYMEKHHGSAGISRPIDWLCDDKKKVARAVRKHIEDVITQQPPTSDIPPLPKKALYVDASPAGASGDDEKTYIVKVDCIVVTILRKRWRIPLGTRYFRVFGLEYDLNELKDITKPK